MIAREVLISIRRGCADSVIFGLDGRLDSLAPFKGLKWVCFFQDTNALVFRAIPASLAISKTSNFAVNSLAVPRKAKEAIGAICKLVKDDSTMTLNVEYNQVRPLCSDSLHSILASC